MIHRILRMLILLGVMALPLSCFASKEPIYINLATDDSGKAVMALDAGRQYSELGFPIIIYLNDKSVIFGVEAKSGAISQGQLAIKQAIANGATVMICPTCLEKYGFTRGHLVSGIALGAEH